MIILAAFICFVRLYQLYRNLDNAPENLKISIIYPH
jgi:hypothetical protein